MTPKMWGKRVPEPWCRVAERAIEDFASGRERRSSESDRVRGSCAARRLDGDEVGQISWFRGLESVVSE